MPESSSYNCRCDVIFRCCHVIRFAALINSAIRDAAGPFDLSTFITLDDFRMRTRHGALCLSAARHDLCCPLSDRAMLETISDLPLTNPYHADISPSAEIGLLPTNPEFQKSTTTRNTRWSWCVKLAKQLWASAGGSSDVANSVFRASFALDRGTEPVGVVALRVDLFIIDSVQRLTSNSANQGLTTKINIQLSWRVRIPSWPPSFFFGFYFFRPS